MKKYISGFTLLEMAVVLMIVGLLLGGLIPTLSVQMDAQRTNKTQRQLDEIKDAIIGYAVVNDRLPCPASSTSHGQESFCTNATGSCGALLFTYQAHGRCSHTYDGFLPAATLGISPTDTEGFAIDSWGNRIHYAVTDSGSYSYTKISGMKTIGISSLNPDLLVCSTASTSSSSCSVGNSALTTAPGVPVVIYSTGVKLGSGVDEAENPNSNSADNDRVFVSHTPTPSAASNGEFDDIVIWISPNTLINRMVTAGKLP